MCSKSGDCVEPHEKRTIMVTKQFFEKERNHKADFLRSRDFAKLFVQNFEFSISGNSHVGLLSHSNI